MLTSLFKKRVLPPRGGFPPAEELMVLPPKDLSTCKRVSPKLYKGAFRNSLVSSSRLGDYFEGPPSTFSDWSCSAGLHSADLSAEDLPKNDFECDASTSGSRPMLIKCYLAALLASCAIG